MILLLTFVVASLITCGFSDEINSTCITPNGENATCIPAWTCKVIIHAINYLGEEAAEFARKSHCDYKSGPLVCCGSVGHFFNTTTPKEYSESVTLPVLRNGDLITSRKEDFLPDKSSCGFSRENDTEDSNLIEEYPWLVVLKYEKSDGDSGDFHCSGTLISQRYVLTAAGCLNVPGYNLTKVRLGEWKFSKQTKCDGNKEIGKNTSFDVPIEDTIVHPLYNKEYGENNIALLLLERRVSSSESATPICLPPPDLPFIEPETLLEITGWQSEQNVDSEFDIKLKSKIPSRPAEECSKLLQTNKFTEFDPACAGGDKNIDTCYAAIGSPVIKINNETKEYQENQYYQEGLIYKKHGCGNSSEAPFLFYIRISDYRSWILSNLKYS